MKGSDLEIEQDKNNQFQKKRREEGNHPRYKAVAHFLAALVNLFP